MRLQGRIAVVTGTRGCGEGIARRDAAGGVNVTSIGWMRHAALPVHGGRTA